jgi:hypothetical protein
MSTIATLPRHMREAVASEFAGERILWLGQPSPARTLLVALPIWLFAVPWTAFALGWEYMALAGWLSGKPSPSGTHTIMGIAFPLFGLPFVLVGLGMMSAPFLAWREARRTVHVIGERRLVTMTIGGKISVKSHPTAAIVRTERSERRGGSGTLKVVTGIRRDSDGDRVEDSETLIGIAEVRKVERLLAAAMDNERRAA